ncbi:MAG: ribbon-helix-helix domain-containing protein [Candidatus Woesearchaeota archaeon]|jgi:Arc/MetJ-type ribon-helix-helix transcriptional regulator
MNTITFKLSEDIVKKMDELLHPLHFNNRTEFIREAIRDKLNSVETDPFLRALQKFKGSAKIKVSDEMLRKAREAVSKKYMPLE